MGPLIPLFWTSTDVCPGVQRHGGSPCLHALLLACNRSLRFTFGVTLADLLAPSMASELFSSTYLRTSIGATIEIRCSVEDKAKVHLDYNFYKILGWC